VPKKLDKFLNSRIRVLQTNRPIALGIEDGLYVIGGGSVRGVHASNK
jgi:hypothetical protein